MLANDILARIRSQASKRRLAPTIIDSATHGGWFARLMGKRYWWVEFGYPCNDADYDGYLEWMADNGAGIIWRVAPDRIGFSNKDDWVMFKVAFS